MPAFNRHLISVEQRSRRVRTRRRVLAVMLPDIDGFAVCRALRHEQSNAPLMLAAWDAIEDRVDGLTAALMRNPARGLSRFDLIEQVWG